MATIPRTYLTTYQSNLDNIQPKNGQIISLWDTDGIYYDAPDDGSSNGEPIRRKVSGVRVITSLPTPADVANYDSSATYKVDDYCKYNSKYYICTTAITVAEAFDANHWAETSSDIPMTDILYAYIGNDQNRRYLPDGTTPFYDLRVWSNNSWLVVGSNQDDTNVKTDTSTSKFYLTGTTDITDGVVGSLVKSADIYATNGTGGMKIHADLDGTANNATNAINADKATNDINSNPITGYVRNISASPANPTNVGTTITFTNGAGTTSTLKIKDTTYSTFTSSTAGLVGPTNTPVLSDSTGLILSGSGWISSTAVPADSAVKDGAGQTITTTYYKDASFDTNTQKLLLTKGDGVTVTEVTIPGVTSIVDSSNPGLAPTAPSTDATKKFLRGDATWTTIPDYTGATSGSAGVAGLVPSASSGDTEKFLKSDGTWGSTFTSSADGLVPKTSAANSTDILTAAGSWVAQNSTGSNNDSSNLLYLVGATSQSDSAQTYSNAGTYSYLGKLYSNSLEVVNLSDSQALTNKTYEGYTLGDACAKTVTTTLDSSSPSGNIPTNSAVRGYVSDAITSKLTVDQVADVYDDTSTSYAVGDYCMYDDGNGFALYKCNTAISSPAGAFDSTKWDSKIITGLETIVTGTLTAGQTSVTLSNSAITTDSLIDIYTDTYGVNPTNITVASGSITLTFTSQASNLGVKAVIK